MSSRLEVFAVATLLLLSLPGEVLLASPPPAPPVPPKPPAQRELRRSVEAAPTGSVSIELFDGSVQIEGWDRKEVLVLASLAHSADEVSLNRQGEKVGIEVESSHPGTSRANLSIKVPAGSSVHIEVMSASVHVQGVLGEVEIEAVTGNLAIEGRPRGVRAETVTGAIRLQTSGSSRLELETVSGSLSATAEARQVDVQSVAGSMHLELRGCESGKFGTTSGRMDIELWPLPGSHFELDSFSGKTTLAVPANFSARYDLQSSTGRLSGSLQGARETRRERGELELLVGKGEAQFELDSFSGAIDLRELATRQ